MQSLSRSMASNDRMTGRQRRASRMGFTARNRTKLRNAARLSSIWSLEHAYSGTCAM